MQFYPEGYLMDTPENAAALQSPAALAEAVREEKILEARAVMCDSSHDLIVELPGMKGVIPREEGAIGIREGTVRDIAILSRVNRPVCFVVQELTGDQWGGVTARLSRRAAQERCAAQYIAGLLPGDVITARVTHIEPFGVFADIGCGISSLLPIDAISVSRIEHPRERFLPGMDIRAVVRSKENSRVTLTHKELLGTWAENAAQFQPGMTVPGVVRGVKDYGFFVELTPNLSGLAEVRPGLTEGDRVSVYLKSILPERMKIKLLAIDRLPPDSAPAPLRYFITGGTVGKWKYAPEGCRKIGAESVFCG